MDLIPKGGSWDHPISQQLLNFVNIDGCKCAVKVDESYCSKLDNEERQKVQASGTRSNAQVVRYRKQ